MGIFGGVSMEKVVSDRTVNIRKLLLDPDRTAIININTTDGYFHHGAFWSPQFEATVEKLVRVNEYLLHCRKIFTVDYHTANSTEFKTFPEHCSEYDEQQIIAELDNFASNAEVTVKNCANAMFSNGFLKWFAINSPTLDNFILAGALTDTDIMQLALSLRSYFNERDRDVKIIVVANACKTFSSEAHDADAFQTFALYNMLLNGISVVNV